MRDFEMPGRSVAIGEKGMVATSNPKAVLAGLDVLRSGGNAVDAAVAAAAMLAVVEPTQTGVGGDCFVILKRAGKAPIALNGSGWAAKSADASRLRDMGMTDIPTASVHAVTVPGAVRAWAKLVEHHGTRPLGELLHPAIAAADDGYRVTERLARDWAKCAHIVKGHPAACALFLANDRSPAVGDLRSNPELAKTLRAIAKHGPNVFYEGWIAEKIVASLRERGGALTVADFADFQPEYVTPISHSYRDYRLWECPPNGQGIVALLVAAMQEQFDLSRFGALSAERFHLQGELARIAYAQRDAYLCDPRSAPVRMDDLLAPASVKQLAAAYDPGKRLENISPLVLPEHRDTVFVSVADASGTMVSFINSLFDDFGSGHVADGTGVLLHNRGCGFVLEEGHPNELAGRKRPMHTIIPALVTKDDNAVMAFGMTGGHFQPSGQLQILSNMVDYGMSVQLAIEHPRMFARGDSFDLEKTVPESVWHGLQRRGHRPTPAQNPIGTCHGIWRDIERGVFFGGSDGRRDGLALGF